MDISVNVVLMHDSLNKAIQKVNDSFGRLGNSGTNAINKVNKNVGSLSNSLFSLGSVVKGGIFAAVAAGAYSIGSGIYNATAEYEKYNAILKNTLGSQEAATTAMQGLIEFAKNTPFTIDQITEAYNRFVNRGLAPTKSELTSFGDFASKSGKDLNQLSEAIADVSNTERWKEFGVKSQQAGNRIKLTFNGITLEGENTSKGVAKLIDQFGKMEGTAGAMAGISKTIGGSMSNLQDSFTQMGISIGTQLTPYVTPLIQKFSEFVTTLIPKISSGITYMITLFKSLGNWINSYIMPIFNSLINSPLAEYFKTSLGDSIMSFGGIFADVASIVSDAFNYMVNFISNSTGIQNFLKSTIYAFNRFREGISGIVTFISGLFNWLVNNKVFKWLHNLITNTILGAVSTLIDGFAKLFSFIGAGFNMLNEFLGFKGKKIEMPKVEMTDQEKLKELGGAANGLPTFDELQKTLDARNKGAAGAPNAGANAGKSITGDSAKSISINIDSIIKNSYITQSQDPLKIADMVTNALLTAITDAAEFA